MSSLKRDFAAFYSTPAEEVKLAWQQATFVLDTNILINLYRYPVEARDALLSILQELAPRLWIPHHVALEYQRNRLAVIAEQKARFSDVRKVIAESVNRMASGLDELKLRRRHASINPDELLGAIQIEVAKYLIQLDQLENKQIGINSDDHIREKLEILLDGRMGGPPADQAELDKLYKDGEVRFQHGVPPGYRDDKKGHGEANSFAFGGLLYRKKFGDLILWKQIIQYARDKNLGALIFLTDDAKDDWWYDLEVQGRKRIGPRLELIDEIRREAGVHFFHMYGTEQFLKYAKKFLRAKVAEESVEQIRQVVESSQHVESSVDRPVRLRRGGRNWTAIEAWLRTRFPGEVAESDTKRADFTALCCPRPYVHQELVFICYSINDDTDLRSFGQRHRERLDNRCIETGQIIVFVLVCRSSGHAEETCGLLWDMLAVPYDGEAMVVGSTNKMYRADGEEIDVFVPHGTFGEFPENSR
jgi:predicted nucleic acid-binding protein